MAQRALIVVGVVIACLVIALVTLRIVGLDPKDRRPGLWLTGELVTQPVTDWSFTDKIVRASSSRAIACGTRTSSAIRTSA